MPYTHSTPPPHLLYLSRQRESYLVDDRWEKAALVANETLNLVERLHRHWDDDTKSLDASLRDALSYLLLKTSALLRKKVYVFNDMRLRRKVLFARQFFDTALAEAHHSSSNSINNQPNGITEKTATKSSASRNSRQSSGSGTASASTKVPPPPRPPQLLAAAGSPVTNGLPAMVPPDQLRNLRDVVNIVSWNYQASEEWKMALKLESKVPAEVVQALNSGMGETSSADLLNLSQCTSQESFGKVAELLLKTLELTEQLLPPAAATASAAGAAAAAANTTTSQTTTRSGNADDAAGKGASGMTGHRRRI